MRALDRLQVCPPTLEYCSPAGGLHDTRTQMSLKGRNAAYEMGSTLMPLDCNPGDRDAVDVWTSGVVARFFVAREYVARCQLEAGADGESVRATLRKVTADLDGEEPAIGARYPLLCLRAELRVAGDQSAHSHRRVAAAAAG